LPSFVQAYQEEVGQEAQEAEACTELTVDKELLGIKCTSICTMLVAVQGGMYGLNFY